MRRAKSVFARFRPMLATLGSEAPPPRGWTFEPKYDGIRLIAIALHDRSRRDTGVALFSRNGNDRTHDFPEIADAVRRLAARAKRSLVLDGEAVALEHGEPGRFGALQGRGLREQIGTALIAFDLVLDGDESLVRRPWRERRARLERRLRGRTSVALRLGATYPERGQRLLDDARRAGWEGVVAKRMDSLYEVGRRSPCWLKLKADSRQLFVVGGYTEPRRTRTDLGALLLGYFDRGRLIYAGRCGGGFTRAELGRMKARLAPLARTSSPFEETPGSSERAHWVEPRVVVEVRFNEWTGDGILRHPVYLRTVEGIDPHGVTREGRVERRAAAVTAEASRPTGRTHAEPDAVAVVRRRAGSVRRVRRTAAQLASSAAQPNAVLRQLDRLPRGARSARLALAGGVTLAVSKLRSSPFPDAGFTRADLLRYYARVAPVIVPALRDRALHIEGDPERVRSPNGYLYYRVQGERVPAAVRVVPTVNEVGKRHDRFVGGDLATLFYAVERGGVGVHPWLSRVGSLDEPDYAVLDLDPGPRAPFARVIAVAQWIKNEMDALRLTGLVKTSGAAGLHIVLPLTAGTSWNAARLLAELLATLAAQRRPSEVTLIHRPGHRPPTAVYVDYLQNARGKALASAYSVRPRPGCPVSTPLAWEEVTDDLDPITFTIETVPRRLAEVGDLWARAMRTRNRLDFLTGTRLRR